MKSFEEFGLKESLLHRLKKKGIKTPTKIQNDAMGPIAQGKDLIGEAQTGTGKTLAFLLPLMNGSIKGSGISLILVPTRELALQITEEAESVNIHSLNILTIYGGRGYEEQLKKVQGKVDIIVATPGRLLDFIDKDLVKMDNIKTVVFDEADQMLMLGFRKELDELIKRLPRKRQTLCFSATMDPAVKKLAYAVTKNPIVVQVQEKDHSKNLKKMVVETTKRGKLDALCTILNETQPFMAIIFARTKLRVDNLEERMSDRGYNTQKIHGDVSQVKREKIIKSFKSAEIRYLIATDVAARGLDITGVTHIFNYDVPDDEKEYIHRIGRTARAGEKGETYLFVTPEDALALHKIEALVGHELERVTYSAIDNVECNHMDTSKKYNKKIKTKQYDPNEEEAVKEGKKPEFKGEKKNPINPKAKSTGTGKFDNKREAKSNSRGFGKKTETRGSKEGRSNDKRSSRGR